MKRILQSALWGMTAWYGLHEGNVFMLSAFIFLSVGAVVVFLICVFAPRERVKNALKGSKKTTLSSKVFHTALMAFDIFIVSYSGSPEIAAAFAVLMIFALGRIESVKKELLV